KISCSICHSASSIVAESLGICKDCLKGNFAAVRSGIRAIHTSSRARFELPPEPPDHRDGIVCNLCANQCKPAEGEKGFCGLREVRNKRFVHFAGTADKGLLQWYRDPLPTNCVADWVCEGHTGTGNHNLAVFYESCTMNCLFCQNWHFRKSSPEGKEGISAEDLAALATPATFCVCFFGGDPSSQMVHALSASKRFAGMPVRICWETNGLMNPDYLDKAIDYSLKTGGCIKFDLKAFDDELNKTLTGISNKAVKENFKRAAGRSTERDNPPLVLASTLLVPGYIDRDQVYKIAGFIASLNPEIPYSLLAFAPQFYMSDLPYTSARHAREAEAAAYEAGLSNVRIGNKHLL
ncbi:MAG: radical SAM protein, partial [Bacteroidales bacterium]